MQKLIIPIVGALSFVFTAAPSCIADAGWVTGGGNPQLMKEEHKTIAMKSEVVNIRVGKDLINVECLFDFENNGPACSVKMGFPDVPLDAGEMKIYPMFSSYKSYVEGKEVETKCEADEDEALFWHTQTVDFPANSHLPIKDTYTLPAGFSPLSEKSNRRAFFYFLSTGASWRGVIESARINVAFEKDAVKTPMQVMGLNDREPKKIVYANNVKYESSKAATIKGNVLTFSYKNLKPRHEDDLAFEFGNELSEKEALELYLKIVEDFINRNQGSLSEAELKDLRKKCDDIAKSARDKANKQK